MALLNNAWVDSYLDALVRIIVRSYGLSMLGRSHGPLTACTVPRFRFAME
jgi:hypothetical protein